MATARPGSESPPWVPAPFPYVFAGPNIPAPRPSAHRFALSSSRTTQPVKRERHNSSDEGSSEEDDLSDPYVLEQYVEEAEARKGSDRDRELGETNKGMQMLLKLGWSQGKGLGKELQGRVLPIDPANNTGMMGLGKATQDHRMLDSTTLVARQLESQRIAKETPDQLAARKERAAYKESIQAEIASTLVKFRCDLCAKSYATVGQYDEHTNSYDHHHKARAVALKLAEREKSNASGESERRREKEAKREAKEMAKKMGAAGIAVATASAVRIVSKPVVLGGAKKGGWAKVGGGGGGFAPIGTPKVAAIDAPAAATSSGGGGYKKSGWATGGALPTPAPHTSSPPPPSSAPPDPPIKPLRAAPAFKSGGLFTLSTEIDDDFSSPLTRHAEVHSSAPPPPTARPPPPSYQPPIPPSSRPPPPPSAYPPPPPSTLPPPPPSSRPPPPPPSNNHSVPSHTLPANSMDWRPDQYQDRRRSPEATKPRDRSPEERRSSSGRPEEGYDRRTGSQYEERDDRRGGWDNPRYPPYDAPPPPPPSYDRPPPLSDPYYPLQHSRDPPYHQQPPYDSRRQPLYDREPHSYPSDRGQTSYDGVPYRPDPRVDGRSPNGRASQQGYDGRSREWEREGDARGGYGKR